MASKMAVTVPREGKQKNNIQSLSSFRVLYIQDCDQGDCQMIKLSNLLTICYKCARVYTDATLHHMVVGSMHTNVIYILNAQKWYSKISPYQGNVFKQLLANLCE